MKKLVLSSILMFFFLQFAQTAFAQIQTVKGKILTANNEPIVGASVSVQGKFIGTSTNNNGEFQLKVNLENGPVKLEVSFLGFEKQVVEVSKNNTDVKVSLKETGINYNEVVVSASRIEEKILEAPVAVTKISAKQILNSGGTDLLNNLARFQGVDVNSSSMLFSSISTRGFNSPKSERMIQLADYADTQVPSLNLNAGNMLGIAELDISSVEIIHGPASALYGANAFNGVLLTNSKDPFYTQGLSLKLRGGTRDLMDGQIRYAKKIGNKFAFKVNASYLTANDWMAESYAAKNITSAKNYPDNSGFGYDALNKYGEISTTQAGVSIIPNEVIYTPGWTETELIAGDNKTLSYRINPSASYLITDKLKATVDYKLSGGTTTYQSTSRYRIKNLTVGQFKAELKSDKWFVRAFRTEDHGGDTYDLSFLGSRMATLNPTVTNMAPLPGGATSYTALFLGTYGAALTAGASPSQAYAAANATWPKSTSTAFRTLRNYITTLNQPAGSKLPVNSVMSDISGQYQFGFKPFDLIVGGAYRSFGLASEGAVFQDNYWEGRIKNYEYGVYGQASKKLFNDALKLQVATRLDNFKNFDSKVSPRASAVYTLGKNRQHNFRTSYGVAFRSPAQIDQFIRLDIGSALLLGNVGKGYKGYRTTLLSTGSPAANIAAVAGGPTAFDYYAPKLDLEQVKTFEVGYKGIIKDKLYFDVTYYRSDYTNFIGAQPFIGNRHGAKPTVPELLVAIGAAPGSDGLSRYRLTDPTSTTRIIQVWYNSAQKVTTQGVTVGLNYNFKKELNFSSNYSYNKIGNLPDGFISYFNTPEHKFNVGLNGDLLKKINYNVNYRFQKGFKYEFPYDIGTIDDIATLDASLSYKLTKLNSTIQIGGSNLTDAYNTQVWGGPNLGRMLFAGLLFEIK